MAHQKSASISLDVNLDALLPKLEKWGRIPMSPREGILWHAPCPLSEWLFGEGISGGTVKESKSGSGLDSS